VAWDPRHGLGLDHADMVTSLRTTDLAPHGRFDPRTDPAVQNIRSGFVQLRDPRFRGRAQSDYAGRNAGGV